jgi:hypothetical protein
MDAPLASNCTTNSDLGNRLDSRCEQNGFLPSALRRTGTLTLIDRSGRACFMVGRGGSLLLAAAGVSLSLYMS